MLGVSCGTSVVLDIKYEFANMYLALVNFDHFSIMMWSFMYYVQLTVGTYSLTHTFIKVKHEYVGIMLLNQSYDDDDSN